MPHPEIAKAHQAGRDEAVAIVETIKQQMSASNSEFHIGYEEALDDTIKALQDNK